MRAWPINGVEKRGKFEKRKMRDTKAEEKGDRIREREREREGDGGWFETELNLLFISEHAIYGQLQKDFHTIFAPPPTTQHFHHSFLCAIGNLVLILSLCMENLLTL